MADSLEPGGYYPLDVGYVWEYRVWDSAFEAGPRRREVLADTLIGDEPFYIMRTTYFDYDGIGNISERGSHLQYVAMTDSGRVYWRRGDIIRSHIWLDQAFNSCYVADQVSFNMAVGGGYDTTFEIPEGDSTHTLALAATKRFEGPDYQEYGHEIGLLRSIGDPSVQAKLAYFKLGDREAGTPLDSIYTVVTSTERPSAPSTGPARLGLYPNPSTSQVTASVVLTSPDFITLTVVDVLGRAIQMPANRLGLDAGKSELSWSVSSLPDGIYFVRLEIGRGMAGTTQLIKID